MKKKILKQRIRDLEMANRHIFSLLLALVEKVQPKNCECPMLALRDGLTADENEYLDLFWRWAMRQDVHTVTQEDLVNNYATMMPPRLQGKLRAFAEAELHDQRRVRIAKVALGLDPTMPENDEAEHGDTEVP